MDGFPVTHVSDSLLNMPTKISMVNKGLGSFVDKIYIYI